MAWAQTCPSSPGLSAPRHLYYCHPDHCKGINHSELHTCIHYSASNKNSIYKTEYDNTYKLSCDKTAPFLILDVVIPAAHSLMTVAGEVLHFFRIRSAYFRLVTEKCKILNARGGSVVDQTEFVRSSRKNLYPHKLSNKILRTFLSPTSSSKPSSYIIVHLPSWIRRESCGKDADRIIFRIYLASHWTRQWQGPLCL